MSFPSCYHLCESAAKTFRPWSRILSIYLDAGWEGRSKKFLRKRCSRLARYQWPGNIRELQNLIERAVILSNSGVLPNPLPPEGAQNLTLAPTASTQPATTLRDSERTLILRTLEDVRWVIGGPKGAAAKLGLKRTTLIHKMQKLGISRPDLQSGESVMQPASEDPDLLAEF